MGSGKVLDEVLTLVMDLALGATDAERGFIMLADANRHLEPGALLERLLAALRGFTAGGPHGGMT